MRLKIVILLWCIAFLIINVHAQTTCNELGQNPRTAFPVCGLDTFVQSTVPACGGKTVPGPCNGIDGITITDVNPYWYKFTCYATGTLGFEIIPNDLSDDYDWQLFDITNHDPNDVYTDGTLFVACNWSGSTGITGASSDGTAANVCASTNEHPYQPLFSIMPTLEEGHEYLLLISHFTNSQSGYKLSFGGGTANITDPTQPGFKSTKTNCDGTTLTVVMKKKMKCNSLAADMSDFAITPAVSTVKSIIGLGCSSGFDMDSLIITFDSQLPPGKYNLIAKFGSDGNTLLDNCNRNIPEGDSILFIVYRQQPTPFDSISPPGCAPDIIQLVFEENIRCSSIAPNGSDFIITGTTPITVVGASGSCVDGLSNIINVKLSQPILSTGIYQIELVKGSDGNTIIDECGEETLPNAKIGFVTKDTVSGDFSYQLFKGCSYDTLIVSNPGGNGIDMWNWTFDKNGSSTQQNTMFLFSDYGEKAIQLIVSNGVCTDTASVLINLDNELKATFGITTPEICPEDPANFVNGSVGNIISWQWDFGDGVTSAIKDPEPKYYPPAATREGKIYTVTLIAENDMACFDTASNNIKVLYTCYIAVPSAFTPNGDGLNDYLYPVNAFKADDLEFRIYNRWGLLLFESHNWMYKWDGRVGGILQSSGTYVWTLRYTHKDTGKKYFLRGTSVLIR